MMNMAPNAKPTKGVTIHGRRIFAKPRPISAASNIVEVNPGIWIHSAAVIDSLTIESVSASIANVAHPWLGLIRSHMTSARWRRLPNGSIRAGMEAKKVAAL
jgi:hypothetical protein